MIRNLNFGNTLITAEIHSKTKKDKWYNVMYDQKTKRFSCNCTGYLCRQMCSHIKDFAEEIKIEIKTLKPKKLELSKRKPKYYKNLIEMVGQCELCDNKENLQVHHIKRIIDGGKEIPRNCMVVCERCHFDLHAHQGRRR